MLYTLGVKITIGNRLQPLTFCESLRTQLSWRELTSTATVALPRRLILRGQDVYDYLKVGETIEIAVGYLPRLTVVFRGYIARVKPGTPIVLECEDKMWRLKQTRHKAAWASLDINTLMDFLTAGTGITYQTPGQIALGDFRISDASAADVFLKLRETYGLYVYFDVDGVLQVGRPYSRLTGTNPVRFSMEAPDANVVNFGNLEWTDAADVKVLIKAYSLSTTGGRKVEVEVGTAGGEVHTLPYAPNLTEAQLREAATSELKMRVRSGYKGHFTAFLIPVVQPSNVVDLRSGAYPERSGSYHVDAVTTVVSPNGGRQEITLGIGVQ